MTYLYLCTKATLCRHFTNEVEAFLGRVVSDIGASVPRESKPKRE